MIRLSELNNYTKINKNAKNNIYNLRGGKYIKILKQIKSAK